MLEADPSGYPTRRPSTCGAIVTTSRVEGYFSRLKRSIDGTHHHVSVEHLSRYFAEFDSPTTPRRE